MDEMSVGSWQDTVPFSEWPVVKQDVFNAGMTLEQQRREIDRLRTALAEIANGGWTQRKVPIRIAREALA